MSLQEVIAEIPRLTFTERITILEVITNSLKAESKPSAENRQYKGASVAEVRGIIKFSDGHIPDDTEIDELRFEALKEKYLQ